MKIALRNDLGVIKEAKVGFSWTNLFFGAFVPLFRGDFLWFFIQLITAFITYGISGFIFPFFYNRIYLKNLLNKGYVPHTESARIILEEKGYLAPMSKDSDE